MKRRLTTLLAAAFFLICPVLANAQSEDLPTVDISPTAGIVFKDPPLALPVTKNFEIAIQTAAKELHLQTSSIESYGWRMEQTEQQRVNDIFTTVVDGLRGQSFKVTSQTPPSVTDDVTVFTATKQNKDLLLMFSAGDIGLVLLVADTKPIALAETPPDPAADKMAPAAQTSLPPAQPPLPPVQGKPVGAEGDFSPVGLWAGSFTCAQGTSGATLMIATRQDTQIEGIFRFYATAISSSIPDGSYKMSGHYDAATKRVFLKPNGWLEQPEGFDAAPIIGSFDAAKLTFSGLFQGLAGCSSFEAYYVGQPLMEAENAKATKTKTTKTKTQKTTKKASKAKSAKKSSKKKTGGKTAPTGKNAPEPSPPKTGDAAENKNKTKTEISPATPENQAKPQTKTDAKAAEATSKSDNSKQTTPPPTPQTSTPTKPASSALAPKSGMSEPVSTPTTPMLLLPVKGVEEKSVEDGFIALPTPPETGNPPEPPASLPAAPPSAPTSPNKK